jgi:nucleotide-binding universal stress UspA family protein
LAERPFAIHLVTAHEEPRVYGEILVYVTPEKMAELQCRAAEEALQEAEMLIRTAAVPYTREILVGPIAAVIAQRADDLGCESIVIGTRGMTALGNLLMGSVATKVIHFANVPVTLVKYCVTRLPRQLNPLVRSSVRSAVSTSLIQSKRRGPTRTFPNGAASGKGRS